MKVGIITLTFRLNLNYGAALQAWALKTTVQKFLHHADEVFVLPLDIAPEEDSVKKYKNRKGLINNLRYIYSSFKRRIKYRMAICKTGYRYVCFEKFNRLNSFNRRRRFTPYQIESKTQDVDIFIIGSDCVWYIPEDLLNSQPSALNALQSVYLGFVPNLAKSKKRISYAASQGTIHFGQSSLWRLALNNFKAISVRELESASYLSTNGSSKPIEHVVDPTLLLDLDDLQKVESDIVISNSCSGFIAMYVLPSDNVEFIRDYANELSKKTGLPIYNLSWGKDFEIPGVVALGNRFGPSEFLAGIRQSSYVVTNSFHGMVFSIIYHKPFTAFQRQNNDFRQINLVRLLGLEGRLLSFEDARSKANKDPYELDIDWMIVEKRRKTAAFASINFLKKNILNGNSTN